MRRQKKQRLKGSFTVEAAFVMGVLLLAVTQGILWTIRLNDQVIGAMMLEEAMEQIRYDGESPLGETAEKGLNVLGYAIQVREAGGRLEGTVEKNGRIRTISMERFEPEKFLRMVSVIEEKTEDEDSVSERDQT